MGNLSSRVRERCVLDVKLGPSCLLHVCRFIDPRDLSHSLCISRAWRSSFSSGPIWNMYSKVYFDRHEGLWSSLCHAASSSTAVKQRWMERSLSSTHFRTKWQTTEVAFTILIQHAKNELQQSLFYCRMGGEETIRSDSSIPVIQKLIERSDDIIALSKEHKLLEALEYLQETTDLLYTILSRP